MKVLALGLCIIQLSFQSLCCCFITAEHCGTPAPAPVSDLPACHQPAPPCHGAAGDSEPEKPGQRFSDSCACEQASAQISVLPTAPAVTDITTIVWQLPPYSLAMQQAATHLDDLSNASFFEIRESVDLLDQGLSASKLCRFLI
jgi:hypothetical protein